MYRKATLTTKLGPINMAVTSGTHVHVHTDEEATLSYRGKNYRASVHLHRRDDGKWAIRRGRNEVDASFTRDAAAYYRNSQVIELDTPTLWRALLDAVVEAANAFLSDADNYETVLFPAAKDDLQRRLERLEREHEEAKSKAYAIEAQIMNLKREAYSVGIAPAELKAG